MAAPNPMTLTYIGAKAGSYTGSIAQGSTSLALTTSNHHFRKGDPIIVEIGGEAGAGARATVGVGGTWPATSYADEAAIVASGEPSAEADGSSPAAYAEDTGKVYYWDGDEWTRAGHVGGVLRKYIFDEFIPLALRATVIDVSGATLTLDTAATVATSGASVWFDCFRVLHYVTRMEDCEVRVPAGEYAIGYRVRHDNAFHGVHLYGDSNTTSKIFSPRGCPSLEIRTNQSHDWVLHDLWLAGNYHVDGCWNGLTGYSDSGSIPVYGVAADNWDVRDIVVEDGFGSELSMSGTAFTLRNVLARESHPRSHYQGGWAIQIHSASNCHAYDCSFDGPYLREAIELFNADDSGIHGFTSRNGRVNSNGSMRPTIEDIEIVAEADSSVPLDVDPTQTSAGYLLNLGNNGTDPLTSGGTVRRVSLEQLADIGQGVTFSSLLLVSEEMVDSDAISISGIDIVTNGLCNAGMLAQIISTSASDRVLTIDGITADAPLKIDGADDISNCTAPSLTYCGDNTTIGTGNTFGSTTDRCA